MRNGRLQILLWLTLFSCAFGYIEAAVVVYLRELYYPEGFRFPLIELDTRIVLTEVIREFGTILLLLSVALLAVKGKLRRFAAFAYCFGVWDLVYYVVLYAILDWPSSLFEWDILFLIPQPWTGPVLAPIVVAVGLVIASVSMLVLSEDNRLQLNTRDWVIEISAGLVIVASFLWNLPTISNQGIPHHFPWWLFGIGFSGGGGWFVWRYFSQHPWRPDSTARMNMLQELD